jgi:2-polyprenyl-6-hydroxyphenyl methylase/3-demethylubiquinone-9 3-methyltransferase
MSGTSWKNEVASGERFEFGKNWAHFLRRLDNSAIAAAEQSLKEMLRVDSLRGKTFLDIGSGSGLFSLAAKRLGASVTSFDFDPNSVACADELRRRFFPNDSDWRITTGSVLDEQFLGGLGQYDVVYSWGVLHHTGEMWRAIRYASNQVKPGGKIFIALYNNQPIATAYWRVVKKLYNRFFFVRPVLVLVHMVYPTLFSLVLRAASGRELPRGMSVWFDLIDWLGGYPFETARPDDVVNYFIGEGFSVVRLRTVGGRLGCNEYVFCKH